MRITENRKRSPIRGRTRKMASGASKVRVRKKRRKRDEETVKELKHYDAFYGQAPPGLVQEEKEKPEDCIPDLPENQAAREFLAKAPTKGLWMPLGKEVKVMKCWRCKQYGHRTGDRECPLFVSGNAAMEKFRYIHEDPMHNFIKENKKAEKEERIQRLKELLESSSDTDSSSSTTSTSVSSSDSSSSSDYKSSHKYKRKHRNNSKKRRKSSSSRKKKHKKS